VIRGADNVDTNVQNFKVNGNTLYSETRSARDEILRQLKAEAASLQQQKKGTAAGKTPASNGPLFILPGMEVTRPGFVENGGAER
jgi:hypothetical protein